MSPSDKLERYLDRIGYQGAHDNNLETLYELHRAHIMAIPYENLDIFLGRPIDIRFDHIYQKLVVEKRGGYCYEMNGLFSWALERLGFAIDRLSARVWIGRDFPPSDPTAIPFRGHQVILVKFEDGTRWTADVGFGGTGPMCPLQLLPDLEQPFRNESHRYQEAPGFGYLLQYRSKDADWSNLYSFGLEASFPGDYGPANYYTCQSPESIFTQMRMAVMPSPEGRTTLRDRFFKWTDWDGTVEESEIRDPDHFVDILRQYFNLELDHDQAAQILSGCPVTSPL